MSAIAANTNVPVSVKCRIGVDDNDSYDELCDFIYKAFSLSPTKHFIIHSRKALLNGISPAENRSIAPLKYEYFYGLLRDFPDLTFTINGGITSVDEVNAAREAGAHGVMVGCAAYNNPWHILGHVDTEIYAAPSCGLARLQVLENYQVYGDSVLGKYGHKPTVLDIVKIVFLYHAILVILGTVMLSGRTTDMGQHNVNALAVGRIAVTDPLEHSVRRNATLYLVSLWPSAHLWIALFVRDKSTSTNSVGGC